MPFLRTLLSNHPLANIAFVVVLVLGLVSYHRMPREQDPEINFNWVSITVALPGASAEEVERLVTNPLEDAIKGVSDVRFVISNSRETVASLLVRFREIPERVFDKRIADLRREIQNKTTSELPAEAKDPIILEITTSNGFPTASLMLLGPSDDEVLRLNARRIKSDLERLTGVDQVLTSGLRDPELLISPDVQALATRGLLLTDVADSVASWWKDSAGGTLKTASGAWSIRVKGLSTDPQALENIPVTAQNRPGVSARLGDVARIERARAQATQYASADGQSAVVMSITKKSATNTLELIQRVNDYLVRQNASLADAGLRLSLVDDQTVPTRDAIGVMQTNALYGMILVLAICWLFLGWRIGVLVTLGIPFSLLGSFAVLDAIGSTINVSVLLGVVIALGMLVDDAVVVVEAIYYRIQRGQDALEASMASIAEVWKPVLASVATTIAAFLPLMLLPGIIGKFMFIIPFVVTLSLLISLVEAFWMMPVHVTAIGVRIDSTSRIQRMRERLNRIIRLRYGQGLAFVLRRPKVFSALGLAILLASAGLVGAGVVRVQFFSFDPIRAFYVNVDMPPSATLEETLAETQRVEAAVRSLLRGVGSEGEARAVTSTAGLKFTETEPVYGDLYGQVFVSLNPPAKAARAVEAVVDALRPSIETFPGPGRKSFTVLSGGPPAGKAVSVKVRGDDFERIQRAADAVKALVHEIPGSRDVQDDNVPGRAQFQLHLDRDAVRQSGLTPVQVSRIVRLSVDGEVVAFTRDEGDKIELRVRSDKALQPRESLRSDPAALLDEPLALPGGQTTRLGALVVPEATQGKGFIRHYNLRRTVTVEANLDKTVTDTAEANRIIKSGWEKIRLQHPGIDLDFSGELEDIEESLGAMQTLFLLGVGLIYLILAAQFRSYWQPLMILVTVPLAFAGVTFGLALTQNPLSLYTLYGVIALTGIAVNSAIVLIDAANERLQRGMSTLHAILHASRRRVIPILITTTTTIGGLLSLAVGFGGKSLLWGPVASSIVWGLAFSTLLTLFIIPLLYLEFMQPSRTNRRSGRLGRALSLLAGWAGRSRRAG